MVIGSSPQKEAPQQAVSHEAIFKQAFWLYGVIVGLSIKEGVVAVAPHIFDYKTSYSESATEAIRFFIFFILIARFYLGAVLFFEEAYFNSETKNKYPNKSFMMDFMVGLFHFLFFAALSRSIETNESPLRLFDVILGLILIYDAFWYRLIKGHDTREIMKAWMIINTATFIASFTAYSICKHVGLSHLVAEIIAFSPIAFVSAVDIAELITGNQYLGDWIIGRLSRLQSFFIKKQ